MSSNPIRREGLSWSCPSYSCRRKWRRWDLGSSSQKGRCGTQTAFLLFSDIPANTIYGLSPGQAASPWRSPSGNSNGLTFDRSGRLLACEHGKRRVSRTERDGSIVAVATHYEGKRLNSPNDIVVHSDGSIYFTDPPYGVTAEEKALSFNGVFRQTPEGDLVLLLDDMVRPNGLAFSPDEKSLYIADTHTLEIRVCNVAPDGSLSLPRRFALMESDMEGGPDGMKVDIEGNLYCAGPGALWVYRPSGELVGTIIGPQRPANLAFGGPDRKTLFLTSRTSVYALRTAIPGVPVL